MGYLKPLPQRVPRGQRFGENPGLGPNPADGHNGDDYKSWVGEPIYAAGDGEVIHSGPFDDTYADNFGWNLNFGGNMVVLNLDGDAAPYVEYGHMDKIYVQAGQRVRRGQVIGTTGATDGGTGVISGPHLHVGCLPPNFNLNTNTYGRVNPDLYLTDYPDETGTISVQSATITPVQEDELSAGDVAAIIDAVQKMHDVTRDYIPGAVWKKPIDYRDPATGEMSAQKTTAETALSFADRRLVLTLDSITASVRGIVDAVKAAPGADAAEVAEAAYKAFADKLAGIKVTVTAGDK